MQKQVVAAAITAVVASGVDGAGVRGAQESVGVWATLISMGRIAVGCAFALGTMGSRCFAACGVVRDQRMVTDR
jgi:hypothetical protein